MHKKTLAFAAVYFGWGSLYLAIRFAVESIPVLLMAGTSSLVAGLLLYVIARISGADHPSFWQWARACPAALALLVVGNGLVVCAEKNLPSSITALLLATEPAWFALLDWLAFRGSRPGARVAVGIVLGFLGVGILVWRFSASAGPSILPFFLVLIAAFSWSWGSLYCKKAVLSPSLVMAIAMPVLVGGAVLLCISLFTGEGSSFIWSRVSARSWVSFLYITMISYTLTYVAYIWLLRNVPVVSVSTYAYVNPVVAMALGLLVGGERLGGREWAGGIVLLTGVVLMLRHPKADPKR